MTTASLAPSTSVSARPAARTAHRVAPHASFAAVAWGAFYVAFALRIAADAGPHHLHELVFVLGGIVLTTALACVFPFLGALMIGSAGTAVWIFLDETPTNAWLALAAYVAMGFVLRRWLTESRARDT